MQLVCMFLVCQCLGLYQRQPSYSATIDAGGQECASGLRRQGGRVAEQGNVGGKSRLLVLEHRENVLQQLREFKRILAAVLLRWVFAADQVEVVRREPLRQRPAAMSGA